MRIDDRVPAPKIPPSLKPRLAALLHEASHDKVIQVMADELQITITDSQVKELKADIFGLSPKGGIRAPR